MRSTRALFASLGASVTLVAAAAFALLSVSAVVALEGWPGLSDSGARPALVVDGAAVLPGIGAPGVRTARERFVVLRAPARRAPRPRPAARRRAPAVRVSEPARARPPARPRRQAPRLERPAPVSDRTPAAPEPEPAPQRRPAPVPGLPRTGDAVREIGDGLSGGVQDTGKALNEATAPLSPPVGHTLEEVTELVAALLKRTTDLLGGALDSAHP